MLITFEQTILSCRFSGITISPYQVFLGVDHLIFEGGGVVFLPQVFPCKLFFSLEIILQDIFF